MLRGLRGNIIVALIASLSLGLALIVLLGLAGVQRLRSRASTRVYRFDLYCEGDERPCICGLYEAVR